MTKTNRSTKATVGIAVAACAICCAPLVIPPLAALVAAGGVGLAFAGRVGFAVLTLIGIGGTLFLRRRNATKNRANCGGDSAPSKNQDRTA